MHVAVVGAGVMGASTALALTDRGHQVTVFEQFEPGHAWGSSHGRSRIVRRAYPDPYYTALMLEAYPLWSELEGRLGERILDECGLLYFGAEESIQVNNVIAALQEHGVNHTVLESSRVHKVFPELRLDSDEVGVFTPEAGWVRADRVVSGSLRLAMEGGATLTRARVVHPMDLVEQFDSVIGCAGGWTGEWFPLVAKVVRQTFAYVEVSNPIRGPVWIEDSLDNAYGFPSEPSSLSIKIGIHRAGPETLPSSEERDCDPIALESISELARRRFGSDGKLIDPATCLYTVTPDEDFRLGEFAPGSFWVSACSGHGFKFGPWIGRLMADFAEGKRTPADYPRFMVA